MPTRKARLSDCVRLHVVYEDVTPFGSVVSGRIDERVREACSEIVSMRREIGLNGIVPRSIQLIDKAMTGPLGDLFVRPGELKSDCLYPAPNDVRPSAIVLESANEVLGTIPIGRAVASELAQWIGTWQVDASSPSGGEARDLWNALSNLGAFSNDTAPGARVEGDSLFVGHAMVRLGSGESSVLFDPFLLPRSENYPANYQPLTASELAPTAIFISHSHPDHFDIGSLARFGPDIPIYVPYVPRESILAIDMEARLREVGFTHVRSLLWNEEVRIGDVRVIALPFYGEQPTTSLSLHPEARNFGNTYVVDAGGTRFALAVDSGSDASGSALSLAGSAVSRYGNVDVVFSGYRSWALYPIRYLFSSVSRYMLFVPRELWLVRQKIMNDADDALDTCERWNARWLIPYADGGAPWYWNIGLGPRLDEPSGDIDVHFDPRPEHVRDAARRRSSAQEGFIESPVRVELARPGDLLAISSGQLTLTGTMGHDWPYDRSPPQTFR